MTWWRQAFVDVVKTADLERLDRPDYDAAPQLGGYAVGRQIGAVFGQMAGALCNIVAVPGNTGDFATWWITLGAFSFVWGYKERGDNGFLLRDTGRLLGANPYGDGAQKGYVAYECTHDPSRAGQSGYSQLDTTALITAARYDYFVTNAGAGFSLYDSAAAKLIWPFVWARPALADAATGTRRQWNAGTGSEQAVNIPTRSQVVIEFMLAYADPTPSDGSEPPWVKVARVYGYDNGTTWNLDAYGPGPQIPKIAAISCFDDPEASRFLLQPGTPLYSGSTLAAAALDPNGDTITAFGQRQDGTQAQYGQAPILGNTINASEFLSPLARWGSNPTAYPNQGLLYGSAYNTPPNTNAPQTPVFLGVAEHLAILRDRLRRLLAGRDDGSFDANGFPWWFVPRYGVKKLGDLADTLDARVTALEPYLTRPQPVASAFVEWDNTAGSYALTKLYNCAFTRNGNNVDTLGNQEPIITFTPALAAVRVAWVEVCVFPNKGGVMPNYVWGADTFGLGYDPTKGGYRVAVKRIRDATTANGSAAQQEVHLRLEGPQHSSAWPAPMATVTGSFQLLAYADPSWTPPS